MTFRANLALAFGRWLAPQAVSRLHRLPHSGQRKVVCGVGLETAFAAASTGAMIPDRRLDAGLLPSPSTTFGIPGWTEHFRTLAHGVQDKHVRWFVLQ